ncbi:M14 family metallopeptidase [Nitritalea halalkaliphila]|nr:M14 metallopeptidase family protein [Nitritalea halalkaliphila]
MNLHSIFRVLGLFIALFWLSTQAYAQIPSPEAHFGFGMGQDYHLSTYKQTEAYFKRLAEASPLARLESIGQTEEGRTQYMMIVTSEENHRKLERYREISVQLARAENLPVEAARELADEGKAIVWIDGGLHSTETVGIHQLTETIYQMLTRQDKETQRILDEVVILFVHANPDGHDKIGEWYMREPVPEKRSLGNLPVLYQKYIGHDNNRDFYIQNMIESQNMGRLLFVDWIPQIMYNHHQRGPVGSVLAGPPYRDPFNHVFDPMMVTGIDAVGAAMYNRLNAENKPGFTRMKGSTFSTWYNGGLRTTTHYHNIIGILTEIIGGPNPESIPVVPDRLVPDGNTPFPVMPQETWHFQQSIDYSVSMNFAVLDYAARNRDHVLMNMYHMGSGSIRRGSQDYWTPYPSKAEAIKEAYAKDNPNGRNRGIVPDRYFKEVFETPDNRDPRAFVLRADQEDPGRLVHFINALVKTGIRIEKATAPFTLSGTSYPAGSYVVQTDQAFRPHVLDMFEPQDYPNDFLYPGGPPVRPYDAAGWTLAYQMGVEVDRYLEPVSGPFETLPYGQLERVEAGTLRSAAQGYLIDARQNDAFILANRLLAAGQAVFRSEKAVEGLPAGTFYVEAKAGAKVQEIHQDLGLRIQEAKKRPDSLKEIRPSKIALYDYYGGSMPSGWVRWILEQYDFEFQLIFADEINKGNLNRKYETIVFVGPGIPGQGGSSFSRNIDKAKTPEAYHHMIGNFTLEESVPQLKRFAEAGGRLITIGAATSLAYHLELPVRNALTERARDGREIPLSGEKYFVPGSVLRMRVATGHAATYGLGQEVDVLFNNSPVFRFAPEAKLDGVEVLGWFDTETPLRSGWAWGQNYLKDGVTAFRAPIGKGSFYAFGPEITYRAQSHGTFKLLFNQLYRD